MLIAPIGGPYCMSRFNNSGSNSTDPSGAKAQPCDNFVAEAESEVTNPDMYVTLEVPGEDEHSDLELQPDTKFQTLRQPLRKTILIRIDLDVLAHLREHGEGWQSLINTVLRQWCGLPPAPNRAPGDDEAAPPDDSELTKPRKRRIRLTHAQRMILAQEFRSGLPAAEVAYKYGVSLSAVYYASRYY